MDNKKDLKKKSRPLTHEEEILKLKEMVKKMPEVHQEKIDRIKKQIESNTYNVPIESVVESIIAHHKGCTSKESSKKKR